MPDNRYWMTCGEYTWEVAVPSPDNSAQRSIYVYEMMRRFGIDPAEGVVPRLGAYMTAVRRCQASRAKDDCRRGLDSMLPPGSIIPNFCPNDDILLELRVNHPGRAKAAVDYCACIADLERFVNEINEVLLDKAADDQLVAELKSRKARLCAQIEKLPRK